MKRTLKSMILCLVPLVGLWGCSRGPGMVSADRAKSLEERVVKLDDELRGTQAARDQLRNKLVAGEEVRASLQAELDRLLVVQKERDELKNILRARTAERDALQQKNEALALQFDGFRKNLRDMIGSADAAVGKLMGDPVVSKEVSGAGN